MNAKTAKLINRFSAVAHAHPRTVKRVWNSKPRSERNKMRKAMEKEVEEAE